MKTKHSILVAAVVLVMLVWLLCGRLGSQHGFFGGAHASSAAGEPAALWWWALALAGCVAVSYLALGLFEPSRRNAEVANHLFEVIDVTCLARHALREVDSPEALVKRICHLLMKVTHYSGAGVVLLGAERRVTLRFSIGSDHRLERLGQRWLQERERSATLDSAAGDDGAALNATILTRLSDAQGGVDALVIPLRATVRPNLLGVLLLHTRDHHKVSRRELLLLQELGEEFAAALCSLDPLAQRQGAEAALRESELRYREIFEGAPVGLFQVTVDGQVLCVNQALADILGCGTVTAMKGHFADFSRDLLAASRRRGTFLTRLQRDGYIQDFEYRATRRDGTEVWLQINARLRRRSRDETPVIDGFVRDNTERKYAEAALVESQRTLATLMTNLPGMAYRCRNDARWTMLFVSEGCFSLTGYEAGQVLENAAVSYADLILPQDRTRVWTTVQTAVAGKSPFTIEYRIRTADGLVKWVREQGFEVTVPGESPGILEGLVLDVSDSKRTAESGRTFS